MERKHISVLLVVALMAIASVSACACVVSTQNSSSNSYTSDASNYVFDDFDCKMLKDFSSDIKIVAEAEFDTQSRETAKIRLAELNEYYDANFDGMFDNEMKIINENLPQFYKLKSSAAPLWVRNAHTLYNAASHMYVGDSLPVLKESANQCKIALDELETALDFTKRAGKFATAGNTALKDLGKAIDQKIAGSEGEMKEKFIGFKECVDKLWAMEVLLALPDAMVELDITPKIQLCEIIIDHILEA